MKLFNAASFLLSSLALGKTLAEVSPKALEAAIKCNQEHGPLSFVLLKDEAVNAAVEDDIRNDLAKIGFKVKARPMSKAKINVARQSGDFHFSIAETWGTPYDPNSHASGWIDGNGGEGVCPAMVNFEEPASRKELLSMVEDVLQQEDPNVLKEKWEAVHNHCHQQAVMMPFWGKHVPALLNQHLTGYEPGCQQFDCPVHRLRPSAGTSTAITIAPGARTGLFKTVGSLNAHVHGPNEFFSNNWIYEGLVACGANGKILPSLATSWDVQPNDIGGDACTFQLQPGVKFHDGEDWNCDAAKLNFDHILAGALSANKHGWCGVGKFAEDWQCNSDMEFQIRTNSKHGPHLQELTLIRPIRMISPKAFISGNATDPKSENSCHLDWGTVAGTEFDEEVNCAGIQDVAGTGPFQFDSKDTADGVDNKVVFTAFEECWGGASAVKRLEIIHFTSSENVKQALINEELDVVWGSGVLSDADIVEIENDPALQGKIDVFHSAPLQNVTLLLNSGKPPFDDINVRKTVIHAINKGAIVQRELMGLQQTVDNIFPLEAPCCDVDLTPKWDCDFEKAVLLSCGGTAGNVQQNVQGQAENGDGGDSSSNNTALALGLGLGLGLFALIMSVAAFLFYKKSKRLETELELERKEAAVDA